MFKHPERLTDAIVLCGGLGERLRPLTEQMPKAMIPIGGRPMLEWQLRWLMKYGVERVIFACGYMHEVIEDFVRSSNIGIQCLFSVEKERIGTSGAVKQALPMMRGNSAFVLNCDILCMLDLTELAAYHNLMGKVGTITVTQLKSPYGICESFNGVLERFVEKPFLPHWINAGIYVFNRDIVTTLSEKGALEQEVFPKLTGSLSVYMTRQRWMAIDTMKDLREMEAQLKEYGDWIDGNPQPG